MGFVDVVTSAGFGCGAAAESTGFGVTSVSGSGAGMANAVVACASGFTTLKAA